MIEKINYKNQQLAIIIRANYNNSGIEFFTTENDSQQLGYMTREKDYLIPPHRHNLVERKVHFTQEVLFIKSGKVRCDFYLDNEEYFKSTLLLAGDVILLSDGGHGFKILEKSEIIEVKQGPYCGVEDKVRFSSIEDKKIKF